MLEIGHEGRSSQHPTKNLTIYRESVYNLKKKKKKTNSNITISKSIIIISNICKRIILMGAIRAFVNEQF